MRKVSDFMDENTETSRIVTKLMMKRAAQRDQGKLEIMHYCVQGKTYSSSFHVRSINLNSNYSVALNSNVKKKKVKRCDYLSMYKLRPQEQRNVSFDDFTKLYKVGTGGTLTQI